MINPTTKEHLVSRLDARRSILHGKGVYNVAGVTVGPLSEVPRRARDPARAGAWSSALRVFNRAQRILGMTRYHAGFHPRRRLYYSLVLDDSRFEKIFRANSHRIEK